MNERTRVFVVDRVEAGVLVLVPDEGETVELSRSMLRMDVGEGAVVRVPLAADGTPLWDRADRDRKREEELVEEGERRLERLRRRDPGGDVIL